MPLPNHPAYWDQPPISTLLAIKPTAADYLAGFTSHTIREAQKSTGLTEVDVQQEVTDEASALLNFMGNGSDLGLLRAKMHPDVASHYDAAPVLAEAPAPVVVEHATVLGGLLQAARERQQ